jgi:hypothetical protein
MARRSLNRRVSLGSVPRWVALAAIIVLSRVVSTATLLWFANAQPENPWTAAQPDLFDFSRIWDSHWYRIIAETGYPTELPLDEKGRVGENAWAFMPIYPFLVRGLMAFTSAPFALVSVVVSVVAFAGFIVVADRLFRRFLGDSAALSAVAVIAFAPVAPVFQVGYAESLGMLFLVCALVGLVERRWWMVALFVPLASLTRPLGVPLALTLVVLTLVGWRKGRNRVPLIVLTAVAGISAVAWPAIAGVVTGRPSAYLDTELAWRRPYIGDEQHTWGTGWWESARWWFPEAAPWVIAAIALTVVVIAVLPTTRRIGLVPLAWSASYLLYLVVVLFPQSSLIRLLAPLFPLAGVVARSGRATAVTLALGIVGQYFWVQWFWAVDDSDWTPP